MNDAELQAFMFRAPDRDLDQMEADVWTALEARAHNRRRGAMLAGGQLVVMALALTGSLTVGSATVAARVRQHNSFALLSSADLAPSTLLTGQ